MELMIVAPSHEEMDLSAFSFVVKTFIFAP
jgi:hypothetical protein